MPLLSDLARIDSNNINATDSAGGVLHNALNPNSSGRAMLAKVKMAANAAGLVQSIFRSLDEGSSLWGEAVVNNLRTLRVSIREDIIAESSRVRENTWTLQSPQKQSPIRRQCFTCKNRGCVGRCRFTKPVAERAPVNRASAPPERTAVLRLYRSPAESVHWFVWTEDLGWFLFPAKVNGWAERRPATNVSRQRLQRVPLRMAFNTGLIEAFEGHTEMGPIHTMGMMAA
jgi:hypothetical protein